MHTNQLYQMQLRFVPLEDRLLFRLNTLERKEYQLWFTRRYIKLLWKALSNLVDDLQGTEVHEQARAAMTSFQHEKAVMQADFAKPYQDGENTPLGIEPVLVSKIKIRNREGGGYIVCLHPESGHGIEITLDVALLHSFLQLISDAVKAADWDLNLSFNTTSELMLGNQTIN